METLPTDPYAATAAAVLLAEQFADSFTRMADQPGFEVERAGLAMAAEIARGYARRMTEASYGQLPAGGAA